MVCPDTCIESKLGVIYPGYIVFKWTHMYMTLSYHTYHSPASLLVSGIRKTCVSLASPYLREYSSKNACI